MILTALRIFGQTGHSDPLNSENNMAKTLTRFFLVPIVVMFAGVCPADIIHEVKESRGRIGPFTGIYRLTTLVKGTVTPEPGATLGMGATNATYKVRASIDRNGSSLEFDSMGGGEKNQMPGMELADGGKTTYYNIGSRSYSFIESGMRGQFSSRQGGELNPAAFGFECGRPIDRITKMHPFTEVSPLQLKYEDDQQILTIDFVNMGDALMMSSY